MKNNIFSILTACAALATGLSSCHDDPGVKPVPETEKGSVQLSSMSIDMSDAEKVIQSNPGRATVDLNDFIVTVTDKAGETTPQTWRFADMPEVLALPVRDDYVVSVESHKVQKAEWERPYYKGSKEFAITDGEITDIGVVTAKFSSLKVTVVFDDALKALMGDDAAVTVKANDEGELTYTKNETRAGYFEVVEGSPTMIAHFEGTIDGVKTVYDTPYTAIEAGQHHIITYKIKASPEIPDQSGNIDPSGRVVVDAEVEIVDVSGNVVVDEDLLDGSDRPGQETRPDDPGTDPGPDNPGPDEPAGDPAATFEATDSPNLNLNAVNNVDGWEGNAIVTIKCPKGIKNLVVTINTDSQDFLLALQDMNLDKPFDLAYPGDVEQSVGEEGLGLPTGDKVIGKTEVPFDITTFVPMLGIYPGNHTFVLSVTDSDNKCETLTLRFKK